MFKKKIALVPGPARSIYRCPGPGTRPGQKSTPGRSLVCAQCGSEDHSRRDCNEQPQCVNCGEEHESRDPECPELRFKNEVLATQAREHIMYWEAEEKTKKTCPGDGRSYSSIVAGPTRSQPQDQPHTDQQQRAKFQPKPTKDCSTQTYNPQEKPN